MSVMLDTRKVEHLNECRDRITKFMLEDSSDAAHAARRGFPRGSFSHGGSSESGFRSEQINAEHEHGRGQG